MEKLEKKLARVHLDETVLEAAAIEMEEQPDKPSMALREEQVKVKIFEAKPEPSFEIPEKLTEASEAGPEKQVYIEDQMPKEEPADAKEAVVASDSLEAMSEAEKASESDPVEEVAEQKPEKAEPSEMGNANSVNEVEVKIEAPRTVIIKGLVKQGAVEMLEAGREQVEPKGQSEEKTSDGYSEVAKVEKEVQIEDQFDRQSAVPEAPEEVTEELALQVKKVKDELEEEKLEKDFVCNDSIQQTEVDSESVTALADKATESSLETECSSTDTGLPSENKIEKAKHESEVTDPVENGRDEGETGNIANSEETKDPENKEEKTQSEPIKERGVEEVVNPEEMSTTGVEEKKDTHDQPKEEAAAQPVPKQSKNLISKVKRSLLKAKKAVIGKSR